MRLWLKDSERRADPAPVKTDDRKAFFVGTVAWVIALVSLARGVRSVNRARLLGVADEV